MSRFLLDTHTFLWWLSDSPQLGSKARLTIQDGANEVYVSAVTALEMSIKSALGKLDIPDIEIDKLVHEEGFLALSITIVHGALTGALPNHHRDPFDRMLVAQAQIEGLTLITKDEHILQYEIKILDAST